MLETFTTAPRPRSIMPGSAARVRCSTAVTLTSSWRCRSSGAAASSEPGAARPALLTSRSIGATSGSASRAATWSRPAAVARSAGSTSTTTPASRASVAAASSRCRSRATSTRSWPSRASRAANAATDAGRRSRDHGGGHTATLVPVGPHRPFHRVRRGPRRGDPGLRDGCGARAGAGPYRPAGRRDAARAGAGPARSTRPGTRRRARTPCARPAGRRAPGGRPGPARSSRNPCRKAAAAGMPRTDSVRTNPGHSTVSRTPVPRQGRRERVGERDRVRPRGAVGGAARRQEPGEARDEHHRAVPALDHSGQRDVGLPQHTRDVDVDLGLQRRQRGVEELVRAPAPRRCRPAGPPEVSRPAGARRRRARRAR